MSVLHQASFFTTINYLNDLPQTSVPEIAFAGRSNAGKSTALNILCNQKRLAFSSKTPGRTQYINYFAVGTNKPQRLYGYLVDLPGYGYSKVSNSVKTKWQKLLADYLVHRPQLRGLVLMMDSRHPFTELDAQLINWFLPTGLPIHVLLTKSDKLTRQESTNILRVVEEMLRNYLRREEISSEDISLTAQPQFTVQLFSSLKRIGVHTAQLQLEAWLNISRNSISKK
ncbi:ribosome biogenesis GTP-binding protein YihA/YsxC [Candidatus Pandoraea novymonadis]|uniref:Probable GTP-binding protein EngB n=1 Tax=Candidatus Pandoraea novymonadis TaxID=1808959 RepID=A0ABX5FCI5_9BURK|nr:ribosome biogenesis GTP-binding protein YihA/YsxC [Candidatus Pandoraea novymonadis]PSB91549.1 putative GTP-binding protein EngB [Candidatus Pandoraea novymonadis]